MQTNFLLGHMKITQAAKSKLGRIPFDLIARHAINEHGAVTVRESRRNALAMTTTGEITSRYKVDPTDPARGNVVIITSKSWGETLVKLETE